ncbi:MAG: hypothetical protein PHR82_04780 [Endomicrobiaceae bacterium]|nr:hypothetical protein [Endomicrobiaceae bacterium]
MFPLFAKNISKNSNKQYVYIIGESSAKGIPYHCKISFAKILDYNIEDKINDKDVQLIDLSNVGNRLIHQYFSYYLYRYTHPFNKGIVIVYAGTNDTTYCFQKTKYYFFYNLNVFKILSAYSKKINDFHYMYESIIRLAKSFGDDIYISTIAGNYAGFLTENVSNLKNNKQLMDNLDFIDNLFTEGKYKQALVFCLNNIHEDNQSHIFYRMGKIYEKQGNIKEANDYYLKAINIVNSDNISRQRPTTYQNEIIRFLADKYEIPCLDIFNKLYDSNEIIGYNFFIDKIHPTIRLNIMIAEGFLDLLSEKYRIKKMNDGITEKNIKEIFNFTNEDLFQTYVQALGEVLIYTYKNEILNNYSLSEVKEYISIIKNLNLINNDKKEEQKKTIEFLEKMLEYITSSEPRDVLRKKIKEIYEYGLDKQYAYAFDSNFNEMLKENKIIF